MRLSGESWILGQKSRQTISRQNMGQFTTFLDDLITWRNQNDRPTFLEDFGVLGVVGAGLASLPLLLERVDRRGILSLFDWNKLKTWIFWRILMNRVRGFIFVLWFFFILILIIMSNNKILFYFSRKSLFWHNVMTRKKFWIVSRLSVSCFLFR